MRILMLPTLVAGMFFGAADRVRADEKPRDTIVRAIKALGGMEKLALDRAVHRKIKGQLLNGADYSYWYR